MPVRMFEDGLHFTTVAATQKRSSGNVDDSVELGDDKGQGTKELASCQASAGWSRRRGVCQDTQKACEWSLKN